MSTFRFDGVAAEDIPIGSRIWVEVDVSSGRATVRAASDEGRDALHQRPEYPQKAR